MATPDEPGSTAGTESRSTVTALRRPPVRQSTVVRSDVDHTFDTFVRTIGIWWPVTPFSAGRDRVRDVTFERRSGGRVYETWDDGTQIDWGTLRAWQPPERFVMSWNITSVATEVELRFTALGPALTRVAVEHWGWEALTEEQLAQDCALPGGYAGGSFDRGWTHILSRFAAAVEAAALDDAAFEDAALEDAGGTGAGGEGDPVGGPAGPGPADGDGAGGGVAGGGVAGGGVAGGGR